MSHQSPRSPQLHEALRLFCLGCFFDISRELEGGAAVEVELVEHRTGTLSLFEYNERVAAFIDERAARLLAREDAVRALSALKLEPATGIVSQGHLDAGESEDATMRRSVLLPLLNDVAAACEGFDWSDNAFAAAYAKLEDRLFGEAHVHRAIAPLIGLTARGGLELGGGARVRHARHGELAAAQDAGQLPAHFGREQDRCLVLEVDTLTHAPIPPDAPATVGTALSTLRLTVPGAIAAGPVIVEFLDDHVYGLRSVPDIAHQVPTGESTRLDSFRGRIAGEVFRRLIGPICDAELLEALDRWELALFHTGPLRAEGLREALVQLLGEEDGAWAAAMRAAALVGETPDERVELLDGLIALVEGDGPGAQGEDVLRRALIACLRSESRHDLIDSLDSTLLGLRTRPVDIEHRAAAMRQLAASS
ncbi:MAG: hypothetical protein ACR2OD_03295 [Gaiellaceae bacterium]